jgi:hypothetical protein
MPFLFHIIFTTKVVQPKNKGPTIQSSCLIQTKKEQHIKQPDNLVVEAN